MKLTSAAEIATLLEESATVAVVGASDKPDRPSHHVMQTIQAHGYRMLPVNPVITGERVHGEYVWRELGQIDVPIDIVDIFRRSEEAGDAVDQAIAVGAKAVWLQLGVRCDAAVARAEAAGLKVVEGHCIAVELERLGVRARAV